MINRKIFAWGLYDFGNSLWVANATLYLSQWLVIDNGVPDIFYGLIFSLSSVLLIFTTPLFGLWSDTIGKRMPFLRVLSLVTVVLGATITLAGTFVADDIFRVAAVLILFFFLNYFYQLSLVFYNAILPRLVGWQKLGQMSGLGEFFGQLGWIAGAILTLPIILGNINFFGGSPRIETILPMTVFFMILAVPMLLLVKDDLPVLGQFRLKPSLFWSQTFQGLMQARVYPGLVRFLAAFYFYSSALLTVSLFFPIYFEQVLGLPDPEKVVLLLTILVGVVLGAISLGPTGDRVGHKRVLFWTLIVSAPLLAVVTVFEKVTPTAYALLFILGALYGGVLALSRSLLVMLSPPEKIGEFFGYQAISARTASIIGPIIWGATIFAFGFMGVSRYRMAILAMVGLLLVGAYILRKVPNRLVKNDSSH